MKTILSSIMLVVLVYSGISQAQNNSTGEIPNAQKIIQAAWDQWRGDTSEAVFKMTIHRPDWERTITMRGWTKGRENSIFKVLEPSKDRDNGTLKLGREMWTYNPKINRAVKIPPSMMSQSWMGSDFSNNDLSKADSIINDYDHEVTGTETHEGKTVYLIKCTPKPDAPVVWGLQTLKVREDAILLEQIFYDEAMEPVKIMTCTDIQMMGGRLFPRVLTMRKSDIEDEFTVVEHEDVEFGMDLPDSIFSLKQLKKPVR